MKKIALAVLAASTFSTAHAADDLSGFYVGASLGNTMATTTVEDSDCWYNCSAYTVKPEGLSYGIQGGQNLTSDSLLYGWSVDYLVTDAEDNFDYGFYSGANDDMRAQSEVKSLLSVRAKAGLTLGKTALVASFGVAQGEFDSRLIDRNGFSATQYWSKYDDTSSGVVYGIALEHAVSANLVVSADLSKYSFDTESADFRDSNGNDQNYRVNYVHNVDSFRLSANYKF